MTDLDAMPWFPEDVTPVIETPRKHRHQWTRYQREGEEPIYACFAHEPPVVRDPVRARTGKQSRNYGNRAELKVARTYGGEKIGHHGGPVDVRGEEFNTQVKTHRRLPPQEWTSAFNAMAANRERIPRLLLRFVKDAGLPPDDYIVVRGSDWLSWFGRDEEGGAS